MPQHNVKLSNPSASTPCHQMPTLWLSYAAVFRYCRWAQNLWNCSFANIQLLWLPSSGQSCLHQPFKPLYPVLQAVEIAPLPPAVSSENKIHE
jgi:hypothetical protein